MKIAIFSEVDKDVREGALQLLTKYANKSPEVIFPVKATNQMFATSVASLCKQLGIQTTAFSSHEFTQADSTHITDEEVLAVVHRLEKGDAIGMLFTDSEQDHAIIHSVEDLALDIWDITEGLSVIEHHTFGPIDPDEIRDAMMDSFEEFVDLLATYVATTVMDSITQAVAENIADMLDSKDISPFTDEE